MAGNGAGNSGKNNVVGRPFKPGQSGNPSGRPSKVQFRKHAAEALEKMLTLMRGARSEKVKQAAARYILDQAFGKAAVSMEITGAEFVDTLTGRVRDAMGENPDMTVTELAEQLTALQDEVPLN